MAMYRALERGQTPDGLWHDAGETFETDAKQGKWMEPVKAAKDPLDHDGNGKKGGAAKAAD